MAPTVTLTPGGRSPDKLKLASGLFKLMRNLGGAIGIAGCAMILNDRTNLHFLRIAKHLSTADPAMMATMHGMESRNTTLFSGDPDHGHAAALRQLWALAFREAQTMTYADAFVAITAASLSPPSWCR